MAVKGKSGALYADAIKGKSESELLKMGYTDEEVEDLRDVIQPKIKAVWDLHPADKRKQPPKVADMWDLHPSDRRRMERNRHRIERDRRRRSRTPWISIHISYRAKRAIKRVVAVAISLYLLFILIGAFKAVEPHDSLRHIVASSNNGYPIVVKSFFTHLKEMVLFPKWAWICVRSTQEEIFMEMAILYGNEIGADMRSLEYIRGVYGLIN